MSAATPPQAFVSARETWHVERALGAGGAGRTWLVRAASSGEQCVLKELHLAALEAWKQLELFERELRVLRSLEHPGIPRVIDVIEDGEKHPKAIVQTFVAGRTLRQVLDEEGPLDARRFARTLRQCLEILDYLHGHVPPIVHRDINPRNVMLDAQRTWLIDFGAVRWALRESTELTSVGTFGYMPPEQILGRAVPASDLYALGVTLLEVATGQSPGDWPTDPASGAIDVRAVLERLPGLDAKVRDTLLAMTRPGLGERAADAKTALRLLEQGARPSAPTPTRPTAAPAPPARSQAPLVVGAVVAMLAVGAGAFLTLRSATPDMPTTPTKTTAEPVRVTAEQPPVPIPMPPLPPEAMTQLPPRPEPVRVVVEPGAVDAAHGAQLTLESEPPGAEVRLGATSLGTTPLKLTLPFGKHTLTLVHGGKTIERTVNMLDDVRLNVRF